LTSNNDYLKSFKPQNYDIVDKLNKGTLQLTHFKLGNDNPEYQSTNSAN